MLSRVFPLCAALLFSALAACDQGPARVDSPVVDHVRSPSGAAESVSKPHSLSSEFSVALFGSEHLQECWTARALFVPSPGWSRPKNAGNLEQAALLLLDEGVVADAGGDGFLGDGQLGDFLLALVTGNGDLLINLLKPVNAASKPKKKLTEARMAEIAAFRADPLKTFRSLALWPPPSLASEVESGSGMKVEGCDFQNKTPLGTCLVTGASKAVGQENALQWSLLHVHYGLRKTADTDLGLKNCLRMGGSWKAPPREDRAAARERLRQRGEELRKMRDAFNATPVTQ